MRNIQQSLKASLYQLFTGTYQPLRSSAVDDRTEEIRQRMLECLG